MIAEFYEGREIFITGGSGVVGKALIEKLLRSCNVGKIYVLLRPKWNATIKDRLEKIKEHLIFRRLRTEKPHEFDEKVVAISGDVALPVMGITPDNIKRMENVTIIFHGAATVRFDEPLRQAIKLNVGGTLEALKFAENLKHLELFMHVSTFFSNPYLEFVENKWYEAPMNWKLCLELSRRNDISDEILEVLTRKLITGFPNTYCFTKNIAESLVHHYRATLPVVIYRPSIVTYAMDDPEPGFPTALTGAMGLYTMTGVGIIKAVYAAKGQRSDFSPMDLVIKSMLYYTMKSVNIYAAERPSAIPIFHTSSCTHSDVKVKEYLTIPQEHEIWQEAAFEKNLLIPGLIFTDSRLVFMFLVIFQQLLPALLLDQMLILSGRKPELMKLQRKVFVLLRVLEPFLFNNYESCGATYAREMTEVLHGTDFHMNTLKTFHSYNHAVPSLRDMVYKVREVLLKENPATLPRSRMIMKIKIILYRVIQIFLAYKLYCMSLSMLSKWRWLDMEYFKRTILLQH